MSLHLNASPASQWSGTDWTCLVQRVAAGDEDASTDLCTRLEGVRKLLIRNLGAEDAQDQFQSVAYAVILAIRRRAIRDPGKVTAYATSVAYRLTASIVRSRYQARRTTALEDVPEIATKVADQEAAVIEQQRVQIAHRVLKGLSARDRDVLTRFYLDEEDAGSIQRDMNLTETQFRLIKSRAKARFTKLVQEAERTHARRAGVGQRRESV